MLKDTGVKKLIGIRFLITHLIEQLREWEKTISRTKWRIQEPFPRLFAIAIPWPFGQFFQHLSRDYSRGRPWDIRFERTGRAGSTEMREQRGQRMARDWCVSTGHFQYLQDEVTDSSGKGRVHFWNTGWSCASQKRSAGDPKIGRRVILDGVNRTTSCDEGWEWCQARTSWESDSMMAALL